MKIIIILLAMLMLATLTFIWWPDDYLTYGGQDLLARVAFSIMLISLCGGKLSLIIMEYWKS